MATPAFSDSLSRRAFIDRAAVAAGGVALVAAVAGCAGGAAPAIAAMDGPSYRVALADAPELAKTGGVLRVKQEDFDFYLVREADGGVIALNNVCSHKKCATKFDAAQNDFACPCHKSRFDLTGKPHGGPAREPLKRFPATLVDGIVTVTLRI